MADWFLILAIVVAILILLVVAVYLLVYYQHPDDRNDAYFPKAIVVLGFVIAGATVLLLPLDVANGEGFPGCDGYNTSICGGLNMDLFWDIMFWIIPIWTFCLIPFATFYYEADDGMLMAGTAVSPNPIKKSKLAQALCCEFFVLVIFGLLFGLTYMFLSTSNVPVEEYVGGTLANAANDGGDASLSTIYTVTPRYNDTTGEALPFNTSQLENITRGDARLFVGDANFEGVQPNGTKTISLQVSPSTFFAGLMAWLGWFLFAIFGGIGIAALPLDFILTFVNRPRHMDAVEFAEVKMGLQERVNELVDIGEMMKIEQDEKAQHQDTSAGFWDRRKQVQEERKTLLEFKQAVFLLEKDVQDFNAVSANYEKYNPLIPYISLILGVVAFIVSIFWILHIILYVLPSTPVTPFLNNYFEWFDSWFPLFGTLSVALFTVYLLLSAVKGCFKFGLRFMLVELHPMKVGRTYMSSFMFNIGLVLLCAMPVVQFCTEAFAQYARFTNIRQIFGVQIQNLEFFGWFWKNNVFVYALLGLTALTCLYLACKPRDNSADSADLRDRLRARRA